MNGRIIGWAIVAVGLACILGTTQLPHGLQTLALVLGIVLAMAGAAVATDRRPPRPGIPSRGDRLRPYRVEIFVPMSCEQWAVDQLRESIEGDVVILGLAPDAEHEEVLVMLKELATTREIAERSGRRKLERAGLILEGSRAVAL